MSTYGSGQHEYVIVFFFPGIPASASNRTVRRRRSYHQKKIEGETISKGVGQIGAHTGHESKWLLIMFSRNMESWQSIRQKAKCSQVNIRYQSKSKYTLTMIIDNTETAECSDQSYEIYINVAHTKS